MRERLRMRKLVEETSKRGGIDCLNKSTVSKAWEDNETALKYAVDILPKLNLRTKNIGIKYHWFKSKLEVGEIECHPIDTKL